jgi:hypothetical protein
MVPLSTLTTYKVIENAPLISHYNLFRSAEIDGNPAPGYSSGDAINGAGRSCCRNVAARLWLRVFGLKPRGVVIGFKNIYIFVVYRFRVPVPGCLV